MKSWLTANFACSAAALSLLFGCAGSVSYWEPEPASRQPVRAIERGGAPLSVMVMPPTVRLADDDADEELAGRLREPAFLSLVEQELQSQIDQSPAAFRRVPLPVGPEAEDLMRRIMARESGLHQPDDFAGLEGFSLPERLLYAELAVARRAATRLRGGGDPDYEVELTLRLVDSRGLTYVPMRSVGRAATLPMAAREALRKGVRALAGG